MTEDELQETIETIRVAGGIVGGPLPMLDVIEQLLSERDAARAENEDLQRALDEGQLVWTEVAEREAKARKRREILKEITGDRGGLTAAGGWMVPADQMYSGIPPFTVKRGGVTYNDPGLP